MRLLTILLLLVSSTLFAQKKQKPEGSKYRVYTYYCREVHRINRYAADLGDTVVFRLYKKFGRRIYALSIATKEDTVRDHVILKDSWYYLMSEGNAVEIRHSYINTNINKVLKSYYVHSYTEKTIYYNENEN